MSMEHGVFGAFGVLATSIATAIHSEPRRASFSRSSGYADIECLFLRILEFRRNVPSNSRPDLSVKKIADIATVRSGYPFRTRVEPDPEGDTYVLQLKDVSARAPADVAGAMRTLVKAPAAHHLALGDVVLKGRGTTHCALVESIPTDLPLVAAAPILVLRPKSGIVEPAFLRWFLNHPTSQSRLAANAVGTYIPTLTKALVEDFEIEVPPLQTQRLIASVATLAERERELLETITQQRAKATDQLLLRLCRTSGNRREQGGRRGAATPRLPDHKQH